MRDRFVGCLMVVAYILCGLFIVGVVSWGVLAIVYSRAEVRAEEAYRAQGWPLTLGEVIPRSLPDEQNAATHYLRALATTDAQGVTQWAVPGLEGAGENILSDFNKSHDPALLPQVREVLADPRLQATMAEVTRATQVPQCRFPVDWEQGFAALFPHLAKLRSCARVLMAQGALAIADGNLPAAIESYATGLRMAGHAAQEPNFISQLVAIAIRAIIIRGASRTLAEVSLPPELARRLYDELQVTEDQARWKQALLMETAMGLETFERTRSLAELGYAPSEDSVEYALGRLWSLPLMGPMKKLDRATYLQLRLEKMRNWEKPWREVAGQEDPVERRIPALAILSRIMDPVTFHLNKRRDWDYTERGLLQGFLALKAYKWETGRYPELLSEAPWPVPPDPFSGQPFRYQRRGEGFLLYSLNINLKDDGGLPRPVGKNWDEGDIVMSAER
jgi:hypothetical protein